MHTFGDQFAEVGVDLDLGLIRVRRRVGVFAPGRVLNRRTAHSQLTSGMLGLSQALLEATRMDPRTDRRANASLADYLDPLSADVPDMVDDTVEVLEEVVNPLGVKGVGRSASSGSAAAIANAVYHAIGTRVRSVPSILEDLLPSAA